MSENMTIVGAHLSGARSAVLSKPGAVDIFVQGGRITDIAPQGAKKPRGHIIHADGAWALPGLWDHHVHVVQWALWSQREFLGDAQSAREAAYRMAAAPILPDGRKVGAGYRDALWPDAPSRMLIDSHTGEIPTYLINSDVHSVWLNSAALRREQFSGLDDDGVLREELAFEVSRRLNATDDHTADAAVIQAGEHAAARGVVGLVDFDMAWTPDAWARRIRNGFHTQHVSYSIYPQDLDRAISEGLRTGDALRDTQLTPQQRTQALMGSLKIISDGSLGTRTAACTHAYDDDPDNRGVLTVAPEDLRELLVRAATHAITVAVHAIGDVAASAALDAFSYSKAQGTIEHAQLLRHSDIVRFVQLGITASVQPQHAVDDRELAALLWSQQTSLAYPLQSLVNTDVTLRFGSDAPVSPLDPWLGIAAATSTDEQGRGARPAQESVSIDTALAATTRNGTANPAALAAGDEADIVLCETNPATATTQELASMGVVTTIMRGAVTYQK
ncbi:amidohydrolase [Microbacterium sp. YY-01]|uniref:amidohydrolase n=1 Tax=Microbacterium sp. YY-01 TaxID=3421634 RepID=UPI003D16371F